MTNGITDAAQRLKAGPSKAQIAASVQALPASAFLDPERQYQVRDAAGKLKRELLDNAWIALNFIDAHTAKLIRAQSETDNDAVLLAKLQGLYRSAGLSIPEVKSTLKETRRAAIRTRITEHRQQTIAAQTPSLTEALGRIVRKGQQNG